MADKNTIKDMKHYMIDTVSAIDQNGHYRRNPDGSIMMQKDADGNDTPWQVSKQGIVPTKERLTLRNKAAKRKWNTWPDDKYYPEAEEGAEPLQMSAPIVNPTPPPPPPQVDDEEEEEDTGDE